MPIFDWFSTSFFWSMTLLYKLVLNLRAPHQSQLFATEKRPGFVSIVMNSYFVSSGLRFSRVICIECHDDVP